MAEKDSKDSFDHVVKTTEQWESRSYEYWIIPRGVLCVELTPDKKTKIKIGEGNKIYSQLPYINSETDLSDYYTKEEIDNILAMLNFVAIPSTEIYPTKESLPQTGNRQGDLRFVLNVGGDPYSYLWFNNKWIQVGGVDLSEYAKKSEVNPRLNALELKAHTHANKSVLDRLTANVIDDSHRHVNKNILDATTAPYTTQDKATLDALAAITVFEGATKTEDGTMGYVPAPLQGQQTYFLKGDGSWAYLAPGDKYKAGEGIYILSGEVISDKFPFEIFPKAATVTQYVIYGTASGVGNSVSGHYEIPIKISAPGYSDRTQTISIADPLYDGDYINFQKQVFAHYRTKITSRVQKDPNYNYKMAIYSDGHIAYFNPGAYGASPGVSKAFEIIPGATYEMHPWNASGDRLGDFRNGMHVNLYDADMNRTRTVFQEYQGNTIIVAASNEKYMRMTLQDMSDWHDPFYFGYQVIYQLYPVETPCQLNELILYPNVINTIDVLTTNKPNEIYVEVVPPDDEDIDPDDPMSNYTGIIYNDGVLDVTQEDPNNLNELTIHFRDEVDKVITIPEYDLEPATTTTLGGVIVGDGLSVDQYGEISVDEMTGATVSTNGEEGLVPAPLAGDEDKFLRGDGTWQDIEGSTTYYPGQGIEFGGETLIPTEFVESDFIRVISVYHGTISKSAGLNSFTLTATDSDCFTDHYTGWDGYFIPAEPNTKYRVSWSSVNGTRGNMFVFEVSGTEYTGVMYIVNNANTNENIFTTSSACNKLSLRFGVATPGTSETYSNITFDKVVSLNNVINAKLGNGLQFDANGAIEAIAGTEYVAGEGIQIDTGTSVIDITNIQWQQGKIDDSGGSEAISDVESYLDCEMFEITSHTSMVTLSGTYDNDIMLLWKPYYYDENENYISTVNTWSTYEDGVQIPINAKYVRFVLTEDETTTLDPNDLVHVEIEYPLEVGKEVITNAGVIDVQVRDRKLIIIKHNHVEEIPIPDPPLATTTTPGIVVVGEDLDIDEYGVLNIADINRLILNAEE